MPRKKTETAKQLRQRVDCFKRYSRIPWSVLTDPRLEPRDVTVYGALSSQAFESAYVSLGLRWIAECVHLSPKRVRSGLAALLAAGHLEYQKPARGSRAVYHLTSLVFPQPDAILSTVDGDERKTPAELRIARAGTRVCGKCGRRAAGIGSSGICGACLQKFAKEMNERRLA